MWIQPRIWVPSALSPPWPGRVCGSPPRSCERLELRSATALEPDRAVLPVVGHHQRPAARRQGQDRTRPGLRIERRLGDQRQERGGGYDAAGGAVVASLPEYPQAMTQRV